MFICNAFVIFTIVIKDGIFSALSNEPMYVLWRPAIPASFSWDMARDSLRCFTLEAKSTNICFSSSFVIFILLLDEYYSLPFY